MSATYRLQLHAEFTFADAERVVPYLSELGVSHLYLSPVLEATAGSVHGYDVVAHDRVSEELGGQAGLERLADAAREHGLGLVVDVVPNHMAVPAPEHRNAPLWQLLREGPQAATASWFDVDWDALDGRIGLPLLGDEVDAEIASGALVLDRDGGPDGQPVVRYHDHAFPVAAGTVPKDAGPAAEDDVRAVLDRQHYLLACWKRKDEVLNYRRFFDIDTLIAVRVEDPEVFDATHRVLLDLNHRGVIEGFRIDHPDGLADPEGYLRMLRRASRLGTAVWVEKILEGDEELPAGFWCEGTTGYDAARVISATLLDPTTAQTIDDTWVGTGGEPSLDTVIEAAKREVVADVLGAEVGRLTRRARESCPDLDPARVEQAVVELLVAGDVYRAYTRPSRPAEGEALAVLERAGARAREARPDLTDAVDRLVGVAARPSPSQRAETDFAVRLQQTWGPVMAKAVEDTAFYRWHRLVALNEVGGDPALHSGAGPEAMHAWAARQQERWPLGMTTLSTHDTKRSEDVRARLLAVAGDGESWAVCSEAFARAAELYGVDEPTAHLLWQTMVGVGDVRAERLHDYMAKAVREAKQHTTWVDGDTGYEERVRRLADAALAPGQLRALVDTTVQRNREAIRTVVLAQKLLQLTLPGTPDTYQGCEVVNLSLVDPDNRRPVDYTAHRKRLDELAELGPRDLDDEKLMVTTRALHLRKELRDCFGDAGGYDPLTSTSRHLVGFTRGDEVAVLVTRAPRRLDAAGGWAGHQVALPEGLWRDELTETLHEGGPVPCAEVFERMPVALLRRVHI